MIVEHAELAVAAGREAEFASAFDEAAKVIAQADGFRWVRLLRCVERPGAHLLLVGWESVEAHTEGFRGSELFARWRALVGPFFAAAPVVEHYTPLGAAVPSL
ncbi:antibiotic biosynthesis monooxygenase family protein [Actinomadura fibrosa]|uniref:Antibiotic biosynthesis monooxygenase family protein n=1 Tax=Actinomadura fibrosa TaxID=111802 RepID=A0ABW2XMU2_9ACTN|nr:antibiotic biosynthesis monooxygenase [Actinomadura fibrosa]